MKQHKYISFGVFLFLASATCNSTVWQHEALMDKLFPGYNSMLAPLPPKKPVLVEFHFMPKNFDVSDDGIINGEFWYTIDWQDPRLAWDQEVHPVDQLRVTNKMIWTPDILPLSGDVEETFDNRVLVLVSPDGRVTSSPRVFVKARCSGANLVNPWVEFSCTLKYGSWTYSREILDFYENFESHIYNDPFGPIDVRDIITKKEYERRHQNGKIYPVIRIHMILKRKRFVSSKSIIFKPEENSIFSWHFIYGSLRQYSFGLL